MNKNIKSHITGINGEEIVNNFLKKTLNSDWEIYSAPHLNGSKPDIICLNPKVGIIILEVKNWQLDKYEVNNDGTIKILSNNKILKYINPLFQIERYKKDLSNIYCPRLADNFKAWSVIYCGIVFPFEEENKITSFLSALGKDHTQQKYVFSFGKETIKNKNLNLKLPDINRENSYYMNDMIADDLRSWLIEPDYSKEQKENLDLNTIQLNLINTRTDSGFRRIRGAAGTGKSIIIAGRAVELAKTNMNVLVISFNITLTHYLRDLCSRYFRGYRHLITWKDFHQWARDIVLDLSIKDEYNKIWKEHFDYNYDPENVEQTLTKKIPTLVDNELTKDKLSFVDTYDAILVDEGQDFDPSWWKILRKVLRVNGEMILVSDTTQNIYLRKKTNWTDQSMIGGGFRGNWIDLKESHRLPQSFIPHLSKFINHFLKDQENITPFTTPKQNELDFHPCHLKWINEKNDITNSCVAEMLSIISKDTNRDRAFTDLTFITDSEKIGIQIVNKLRKLDIETVHTFKLDGDKRYSQKKRKMSFWKGVPKVKATTIHSFKGWEARLLIVNINQAKSIKDYSVIYTALTRIKKHNLGSHLTVICSDEKLFEYGKTWKQ